MLLITETFKYGHFLILLYVRSIRYIILHNNIGLIFIYNLGKHPKPLKRYILYRRLMRGLHYYRHILCSDRKMRRQSRWKTATVLLDNQTLSCIITAMCWNDHVLSYYIPLDRRYKKRAHMKTFSKYEKRYDDPFSNCVKRYNSSTYGAFYFIPYLLWDPSFPPLLSRVNSLKYQI